MIDTNNKDFRLKYDELCKKILSNKRVLAIIMKTLIPEYEKLDYPDIEECIQDSDSKNEVEKLYSEDIGIENNKIVYDLLFRACLPGSGSSIGILINIEAQSFMNVPYPLVSRAVYYGARLLSGQKNDYRHLEKIYSIWICADNRKDAKTSITEYNISETLLFGNNRNNKDDYGLINIVMIYLSNDEMNEYFDDSLAYKQLTEMLKITLARDIKMDESVKEKLENEYGILMSKEDIADMCNWSEGFEERGYLRGVEETKISNTANNIKKIMSSLNTTFENAADIIELDDEIREEVIKIFKEKYS